ncbi:Endothelin-converting enzyme 2, partial [Cladochytrium tenue]
MLGSKRLLKWMDDTEEPCEDFFAYACGGFQEMYKDMPMANTLKLMQQSNSLLIEQILRQESDMLSKSETEDRVFSKAVGYFESCLDTDTINERGFDPIIPLAKSLVAAANDTKIDIPGLLGRANAQAVYILFRFGYSKVENADPKDLRLQIFPAPAFKIEASVIEDTLRLFIKHGVIGEPEDSSLSDVAEWISNFELLAAHAIKEHNAMEPRKHITPSMFVTMEELNDRTGMDWNNYLSPMNMSKAEKKWFLWGDGDLWLDSLRAFGQYDRRDLMYLTLWRLATSHFSKLGREHYNMWATRIWPRGVVSEYDNDAEERALVFQSDCVRELGVHLNYLTGHLFVKYAFNGEHPLGCTFPSNRIQMCAKHFRPVATQRAHASDMIDDLFVAYKETLQQVPWMDEDTRTAALKKLANMVRVVGYPDWVGHADEVDEYYTNLHIEPDKYFENALQAHAFYDLRSSQHQVGRPLERETVYFSYPWQINAFHLSDYIQVQINSGILQRPLYSHRNPDAMNFGSLGAVIGHEITHSFDAKGYKIDFSGVKRPWWSEESNERFARRRDCFVRQYDDYEVAVHPDGRTMQVNGTVTVSENIADNGGLDVALRAWRRALRKSGRREADPLPGYGGLSALQVFFIAYAQTWCSVPNYAHTRFL